MHDFDNWLEETYQGRMKLPIEDAENFRKMLNLFLSTEKGQEYLKG